jgi:hypothetical protein
MLTAPLWVVASMVQPGLSRPGGRGRRFNSLHPRSSYSCLSSGSTTNLNPLAAPPSSLFYLRLVTFCYFLSSLIRFHPLLIRFLVARFVHFVKMFFFFQAVKIVELFPSTNECKREEPRVRFIEPLKFLKNTWEPPKDFFCLFMFYKYT